MPIDPRIAYSAGDFNGVAAKIADVDRRMRMIEARDGTQPPNSVQGGQIGPLSINTGHIQAGAIDASVINAQSIGAATGAFVNINASQITAGNIDTSRMTANVVSAVQASISTLSAITSNMGSITAGTITGGTIQSGVSGARWVGDAAGLRGYNASNVKTFEIGTGTGAFISADPVSIIPGAALSAASFGGGNLVPNSSFEQGTNPDTGATGNEFEGWQVANAATATVTTPVFHGTKAARLTASSAGNMWIGKRDTPSQRIPVVPGRPYTISFWVRASTVARFMDIYHYWYKSDHSASTVDAGGWGVNNADGVYVPDGETLNSTTDWKRIVATLTAPSDAAFLGFVGHIIGVASGEQHFVDAVQVEQGDVPTAYAPKPDEVLYSQIRSLFIGAGEVKANSIEAGAISAQHLKVGGGVTETMVLNGGFEAVNASGRPDAWDRSYESSSETADNVATTTAAFTEGARSLLLSTTVAFSGAVSRAFPVTPGQKIAVRVRAQASLATTAGRYVRMYERSSKPSTDYVYGLNHPDTATRQTSVTDLASNQPFTSAWTTYEYTYTVPAGVYYVSLGLLNWNSGQNARFDEVDVRRQIGAVHISDGSITAEKIIAVSLAAVQANVSTLSAITANMGTITAGTITGATVQTAASGARTVMNSSGLTVYNSSDTVIFQAIGGAITVTGATIQSAPTGDRVTIDSNGMRIEGGSGPANRIDWTTGGVQVATTYGFTTANNSSWLAVANKGGGANQSYIQINAAGAGTSGVFESSITLSTNKSGVSSGKLLLNHLGQSDFYNRGGGSSNGYVNSPNFGVFTGPWNGTTRYSYTAFRTCVALVTVNCSAYVNAGATRAYVDVLIGGAGSGYACSLYFNNAGVHLPLVPVAFAYNMTAGTTYNFGLQSGGGGTTFSDANDFGSISVVELQT